MRKIIQILEPGPWMAVYDTSGTITEYPLAAWAITEDTAATPPNRFEGIISVASAGQRPQLAEDKANFSYYKLPGDKRAYTRGT